MAKLYAIAIHEGKMTIDEVPSMWKQETIEAYFEKYGERL